MSLTSRIASPFGPKEEADGASAEVAGLPGVQPRAVLCSWRDRGAVHHPVNVQLRSHFASYGSVTSINGHDAAHASKAMADVLRLAVLRPATHVARAIGDSDARCQHRVSAVFVQVINGEIRPVTLRRDREVRASGSP